MQKLKIKKILNKKNKIPLTFALKIIDKELNFLKIFIKNFANKFKQSN